MDCPERWVELQCGAAELWPAAGGAQCELCAERRPVSASPPPAASRHTALLQPHLGRQFLSISYSYSITDRILRTFNLFKNSLPISEHYLIFSLYPSLCQDWTRCSGCCSVQLYSGCLQPGRSWQLGMVILTCNNPVGQTVSWHRCSYSLSLHSYINKASGNCTGGRESRIFPPCFPIKLGGRHCDTRVGAAIWQKIRK